MWRNRSSPLIDDGRHRPRYDERLGQFLLPYADVARTADPDKTVLAFFKDAYEAAAMLADWDRSALERS